VRIARPEPEAMSTDSIGKHTAEEASRTAKDAGTSPAFQERSAKET